VAVAPYPASAVADDELARHLHAGLRDLVHLTDLADRVTADDLWDKVIAIEPACARRIVHTAATLASRRLAVVQVPGPSLSLPWAAGPGIFTVSAPRSSRGPADCPAPSPCGSPGSLRQDAEPGEGRVFVGQSLCRARECGRSPDNYRTSAWRLWGVCLSRSGSDRSQARSSNQRERKSPHFLLLSPAMSGNRDVMRLEQGPGSLSRGHRLFGTKLRLRGALRVKPPMGCLSRHRHAPVPAVRPREKHCANRS
jgi:hypothetical protein